MLPIKYGLRRMKMAKNGKPLFKKWWFWVIVIIIVGAIASPNSTDTKSGEKQSTSIVESQDKLTPAVESTKSEEDKKIEKIVVTAEPVATVEPEANLTTGQKNALKAAKKYLNLMAFSHDGLVEQLEFEQYSHEDAVYAADNCGADWNEQALKAANKYLNLTAFSHDGLVAQLEYEKYTTEEATYGADNCGADWNEQAVKCAKRYLDLMAMSKEDLIQQLEYEKFTHEQAVYGAEQNGY